jgi:hypothetical protein
MKAWSTIVALMLCLCATSALAAGLDPAVQAKVDAQVQVIKTWAANPAIVAAVKAANASPSPESAAMTQDKWAGLSVLDPAVRAYAKNAAADFLKSQKTEVVAEAFVSAANGNKVAFLSKPSNWCHKGKPKHDQPMTGKIWQGAVEVDESSGIQSVQVAVPVMDAGKPAGSLVVGLALAKLK